MSDNVESKLTAILLDELLELDGNLGVEDDLFEAGFDSMAFMQLLLLIEEHFGVAIPAAELSKQNFSSVASISQLIRRQG